MPSTKNWRMDRTQAHPGLSGGDRFCERLRDCERQLRSTLEDWLLLGLRLGHALPVVAGIDLNKEATYAAVESL